MPEGAMTSFIVCDAYRYSLRVRHSHWGHKVQVTPKIFNCNEYNIVVFYWDFNSTKKYYPIGRLWYDLVRFSMDLPIGLPVHVCVCYLNRAPEFVCCLYTLDILQEHILSLFRLKQILKSIGWLFVLIIIFIRRKIVAGEKQKRVKSTNTVQ